MRRILILVCTLALAGCTSRYVIIDADFTTDLIKNPTFKGWEEHGDELLYLVSIGDKRAMAAAVRIIPVVRKSDQVTNIDWLASTLYEHLDWNAPCNGFEIFSSLTVEDQAVVIQLYDAIMPVDWGGEGAPDGVRAEYLSKHSQVALRLQQLRNTK